MSTIVICEQFIQSIHRVTQAVLGKRIRLRTCTRGQPTVRSKYNNSATTFLYSGMDIVSKAEGNLQIR